MEDLKTNDIAVPHHLPDRQTPSEVSKVKALEMGGDDYIPKAVWASRS